MGSRLTSSLKRPRRPLTLVNWAQFELGQLFVIPRRHAPTLFDLTDEQSGAVIRAVRRAADALVRAYDPDGLNLIQNNGVVAGQEAPYFHVHVVPRRRVGSDWGNGPPHIAVLERKTPTKPDHDVIVSLERGVRNRRLHPTIPRVAAWQAGANKLKLLWARRVARYRVPDLYTRFSIRSSNGSFESRGELLTTRLR